MSKGLKFGLVCGFNFSFFFLVIDALVLDALVHLKVWKI